MVAAGRGRGVTRRNGDLYRTWPCARPVDLDPRRASRVVACFALTASEWLRGHLFSGFPWNTFGYALISPLWLAQSASLIGIWG